MQFFQKTQIFGGYECRTLINSCRMPYYNSSLFTLYAYGESAMPPGSARSLCHAYWSLEFIEDGELFVTHGEMKYHLRGGDFLILYPGNRYVCDIPKGVVLKKKAVMLNNSPLISLLCNQTALSGRELLHLSDVSAVDALFVRIRELAMEEKNSSKQTQLLANAVFSLFTELIAQCGSACSYHSFESRLGGLGDFMKFHSLDDLAAHFKMGKWTLNRMFKKHLNCTPMQYLIFARMKYACQLLCSNTLSIKAVSEECGYRSPSFFSAEFRKYFGKTPLEFRNSFPIFSDAEMKKRDKWN